MPSLFYIIIPIFFFSVLTSLLHLYPSLSSFPCLPISYILFFLCDCYIFMPLIFSSPPLIFLLFVQQTSSLDILLFRFLMLIFLFSLLSCSYHPMKFFIASSSFLSLFFFLLLVATSGRFSLNLSFQSPFHVSTFFSS